MIDWDTIILFAWLGSWVFWYVFGYSLGRHELSQVERGIIKEDLEYDPIS